MAVLLVVVLLVAMLLVALLLVALLLVAVAVAVALSLGHHGPLLSTVLPHIAFSLMMAS